MLRTKGGTLSEHKEGIYVSAEDYEARKYRIHSAMPLITAYKLCPNAVFLPVDMEEYSRVSEVFKNVLHKFSPVMEDVGIDEAFLDLSDIHKGSEQIAKEIKEQIKETTGLSCSIGIAPNKLLAKISSDLEKPDGLTIISGQDIEQRIWILPVRKLWGVGPKTESSLKAKGIDTIGKLAAIPLETLVENFGNSYGRYLYEASRGIDDSPLVTHWEPKTISRETTFQTDTDHWQTIAKNLADLTRETVAELRERQYHCKNVTVKIRFNDFKTHTRATTMEETTNNLEKIRKAAFYCLGHFELKKKVRLVGVRLGALVKQ